MSPVRSFTSFTMTIRTQAQAACAYNVDCHFCAKFLSRVLSSSDSWCDPERIWSLLVLAGNESSQVLHFVQDDSTNVGPSRLRLQRELPFVYLMLLTGTITVQHEYHFLENRQSSIVNRQSSIVNRQSSIVNSICLLRLLPTLHTDRHRPREVVHPRLCGSRSACASCLLA